MTIELLSALCLVVVMEGLLLFAAPRGWRSAVEQLRQLPDRVLRILGGTFVVVGLIALWLIRGA